MGSQSENFGDIAIQTRLRTVVSVHRNMVDICMIVDWRYVHVHSRTYVDYVTRSRISSSLFLSFRINLIEVANIAVVSYLR